MKKFYTYFLVVITLVSIPFIGAAEKVVPKSNEQMVLSFAPLVKKSAPAVVNIYSKKKVEVQSSLSPFFSDPTFKYFFGDNLPGGVKTERLENSLGSGVIVDKDGYIITSHHVISGSSNITVILLDRREFPATVVVSDPKTDLALLKIDVKNEPLPFIELMDSDKLEVGDIVLAIGNPFGVGQTVTNGIVSAVARTTIGVSDYEFFIQTDAAINPGNSGGALINMEGKLAGINTAIVSSSGGSNGVGFAIPSNMAASVINNINGSGKIVRPWLGVLTQPVTQDIANSLGLKLPNGALITKIHPDGPAAKAGIQVGDVVLKVDDNDIIDDHALAFRTALYEVGSSANFLVFRNGTENNMHVSMLTPPENPKRDIITINNKSPISGASIGNLSPALADELGINFLDDGVVITDLGTQSIAFNAGFKKRDVILKINNNDITTTKQAKTALDEKTNKWVISIKRGGRLLNIIWSGAF